MKDLFLLLQTYLDPSGLPRRTKRLLMLALDLLMIPLAIWSAFALRLGEWLPDQFGPPWWLFAAAPLVSIPIFIRLGLYRAVLRFMGSQAFVAVLKGVTLSSLILATLALFAGGGVPRSVFVIYWGVALLYIGGSRYLMRAYFHHLARLLERREPICIYGAGAAGAQLAAALNHGSEFEPVAFIDDNRSLHGGVIHGLRIYDPNQLPWLMDQFGVTQVLLAMPNVPRARRRAIVDGLEHLPIHVRTVPSFEALVSGGAQLDEIREVDIEDILGRDPVQPVEDLLDACLRAKTVMVTGAGGSIGSELCRQILRHKPARLVLFELSEHALYQLERELRELINREQWSVELVALLGSVLDRNHLEAVIRAFHVQTIYHAAAYKHVPMVEHNMVEGVRNNVFGTLSAAAAAINTGVETFVFISTDKAVRPTNVMGASKRFAELVLQALSDHHRLPRFSMVRFGNVLGSSGSVVPLFREQIRKGGPVTVTHPEIIRYFMTIPEAAQLVIQAGSMGVGGDIFVLDMGEPVKIADLARKMIHLMGLEVRDEKNPHGDIEIQYTGLRPGEKLFEELLIGDNATGTRHPRILRAGDDHLPWSEVRDHLDHLDSACQRFDCEAIRNILLQAVHGYAPYGAIEDALWKRRAIVGQLPAPEDDLPPNVLRLDRAHNSRE